MPDHLHHASDACAGAGVHVQSSSSRRVRNRRQLALRTGTLLAYRRDDSTARCTAPHACFHLQCARRRCRCCLTVGVAADNAPDAQRRTDTSGFENWCRFKDVCAPGTFRAARAAALDALAARRRRSCSISLTPGPRTVPASTLGVPLIHPGGSLPLSGVSRRAQQCQ